MIEILFEYGAEVILIKIEGSGIKFGNTAYGTQLTDITGLKLSREGVEKEFPDLEYDLEWREKAIERFKAKIKKLASEKARADYIIEDLKKHGYIPRKMQVSGRRPVKLDGGTT